LGRTCFQIPNEFLGKIVEEYTQDIDKWYQGEENIYQVRISKKSSNDFTKRGIWSSLDYHPKSQD
jgi:hypothetical protein